MHKILAAVLASAMLCVGFYFSASSGSADATEGYESTLSYSTSNAAVYTKFAVDTYVVSQDTAGAVEGISDAELYRLAADMGVTIDQSLSAARKDVLKAAFAAAKIHIPYWYGGGHYGDPVYPGISRNNFGSPVAADSKGRNKRGLDCSGFVGWAFITAGLIEADLATPLGNDTYAMWDTASMRGRSTVSQLANPDKLRPGDIGFEKNDATSGASDHTGIFLGKRGNELIWIDDSGTLGTTVRAATCFSYYYTVTDMDSFGG